MTLIGLMSLLLISALENVPDAAVEAAQGTGQRVTVTRSESGAGAGTGSLPQEVSEYVFLHQNREEGIPLHAMEGVKLCPE